MNYAHSIDAFKKNYCWHIINNFFNNIRDHCENIWVALKIRNISS